MLGIELTARFALPPNSLSYCGSRSFPQALASFLAKKDQASCKILEDELKKFSAHYAYLCLIASENKRSPFDFKVCEAFWLGNSLLSNVRRESVERLILHRFCGPGLLSERRAGALAANLPRKVFPHHSFHAFYIRSISGALRPSLRAADMCRVSWGKVIKVEGDTLILASQKIVKEEKFRLVPCTRKVRLACRQVALSDINEGDLVACHWGFAVMKISHAQQKNLEFFTAKNLQLLGR